MFTGIIESMGRIEAIELQGGNTELTVYSPWEGQLKVDQSIAHDGVCLTVTAVEGSYHKVTAIEETLQKTNLGQLAVGSAVNLERCVLTGSRFDGHIVQGHVDGTGVVDYINVQDGSWSIGIKHAISPDFITVRKGSICLNGISLTVVNRDDDFFSVAIIPYTWHHTNLQFLNKGQKVNLEFDILGKYLSTIMERQKLGIGEG
jgi:riboflavin synthase